MRQIEREISEHFVHTHSLIEFSTVLLVFWLESSGIQSIPGIPWNGILAVVPAKIVISIPRNPSGFRNGHRNHQNRIASGIDWNRIRGIFFNSNSN